MPPQLLALSEGPNILLDKPVLLIGRHQECDIQIPSRKISRRHCCLAQVNDHLVVRDLCSTNGIRINGARVLEGRLAEGDELTIGNYRYQVRLQELPEEAAPPPQARKDIPAGPSPPVAAHDDAALESCEEPVLLPDVNEPGPVIRSIPIPPPGTAANQGKPPVAPPKKPGPPSFILPENIELAPSGDDHPPFPKLP